MKRLICAVLLLVSGIATAQQEQTSLPFNVICVSWDQAKNLIDKYNEKPMLHSRSYRTIQGQLQLVENIIFVNSETHSWTWIERWYQDLYCVLGAGEQFEPYSFNQ